MPNFTPNFALPYPSASDAPCDFDEQWCDFTTAVDSVFTTFDTGLARVLPVVPVAVLARTVPVDISSNLKVTFDTVVIDTAGMTDLDADPSVITISRPGCYTIAGYILLESSGLVDTSIALLVNGPSFTVIAEVLDRGVINYSINAYSPIQDTLAGAVTMNFNPPTVAVHTVSQAWMAVMWHADRQNP